jgi:hypothetical protein
LRPGEVFLWYAKCYLSSFRFSRPDPQAKMIFMRIKGAGYGVKERIKNK